MQSEKAGEAWKRSKLGQSHSQALITFEKPGNEPRQYSNTALGSQSFMIDSTFAYNGLKVFLVRSKL